MTVLTAIHFWRDGYGRRQHTAMPATAIKSIQETISAYWRAPYSNLGFLRATDHAKSHPGRYYPDPQHLQSKPDL